MRTITILFDGADVHIETQGFSGATCLKATAALERALGVVTKDTKTAEYAKVDTNAKQGA